LSAGFDAGEGDPLGECKVTPLGLSFMTQQVCTLAGGKVVLALEGGYSLDILRNSAAEVSQLSL
jgi:histone deacetylase 6